MLRQHGHDGAPAAFTDFPWPPCAGPIERASERDAGAATHRTPGAMVMMAGESWGWAGRREGPGEQEGYAGHGARAVSAMCALTLMLMLMLRLVVPWLYTTAGSVGSSSVGTVSYRTCLTRPACLPACLPPPGLLTLQSGDSWEVSVSQPAPTACRVPAL